jgi:hypothetical protein
MIAVDANVIINAHPELMNKKQKQELRDKISDSKRFVERERALLLPLWCYLEILGVVSHVLNKKDWRRWAYYFVEHIHRNVDILFSDEKVFDASSVIRVIARKLRIGAGDALIVSQIESRADIDLFVTWDTGGFVGCVRESIRILNPKDALT